MNLDTILTSMPPMAVYLLVGLVISVESMGIPLPGEVVLVTAALLSSRHDLSVSPVGVGLAGAVGAIVGDSVGYLAGRRWGRAMFDRLGHRFPHHASPAHVSYAEHVFSRHGALAVFFGRFVALLRIFAGPLAGTLRMRYPRFLAANASGGIVWAGGTTALVYTLGVVAQLWLQRLSWIALVAAAAAAVVASRLLGTRISRAVEEHARAERSEDGQSEPGRPTRCLPRQRGGRQRGTARGETSGNRGDRPARASRPPPDIEP